MPEPKTAEHGHAEPTRWLQQAVILHLGVLIVGLSWSFGGQAPWARHALQLWDTVGAFLFIIGVLVTTQARGRSVLFDILRYLWPLLLFDALVLASAFNPSMTTVQREGSTYLMVTDPPFGWLPSSARPDLSLRELCQFNGIVLSCFNAFLVVQRRRWLRLLLAVVAGNALLLAIFGTFQKLVGAHGLWFGLVESPQPLFFATFVYHNHWGAFTLLNTAVCLGLLFRTWSRHTHRDLWHSPLAAGAVATLLLAATIPLSASRSSTLLVGFLLWCALAHALFRIIRERRAQGRSARLPVLLVVCAALLSAGAIAYLGRDVIAQRVQTTSRQLDERDPRGYVESRTRLYRDTWRMAMERPYFGWGLETYGSVFDIFDSTPYFSYDRFRPRYVEAHSDWLQSVAESGLVGTGLLVTLGCIPVWSVRRRLRSSPLVSYPLAGCGLLLLYAWVEFPFANPSVMVGFWSCLYIAARYAGLDRAARSEQTTC